MNLVTAKQAAEMQARADAATAGPWDWQHDGPRAKDMEFIAHSRADLPALLASYAQVVAALEERLEHLHDCNAVEGPVYRVNSECTCKLEAHRAMVREIKGE